LLQDLNSSTTSVDRPPAATLDTTSRDENGFEVVQILIGTNPGEYSFSK
jgi:hypothetical protein